MFKLTLNNLGAEIIDVESKIIIYSMMEMYYIFGSVRKIPKSDY